MKARHWVTLIVFLGAGALLTGIVMRLQAGDDETVEESTGDATVDSVRAAVRSTAAQSAFGTEIALPVRGTALRRDTFVVWVSATGDAAPLRRTTLRAEVEGPLTSVGVREGGSIASGALVAQIDPTLYEIRVRQQEAAVAQAQAEYEDKVLFDDQIDDPAVRAERARQARIRVGLDQQEATLEERQYELAKTSIRAPFGGRVANVAVASGSRVNPGDSLATLLDLSEVEIDARVLHSELPLVEVGRVAFATFAAIPGETFRGRVVSVNPLVDPETKTARVTVRLQNPGSKVLPELPGEVRIAGRLLHDRTFVPKEAIVERDRRPVIFVFEPGEPGSDVGNAQWKYVELGLESGEYREILRTPEDDGSYVPIGGEIVLTDGHATLVHDARVRIENAAEVGGGGR